MSNNQIYPLFIKDAYKKILGMKRYREIEVEILNPKSVVRDLKDKKEFLVKQLSNFADMGAERMNLKLSVINRKKTSILKTNYIHKLVSYIQNNILQNEDTKYNVEKVIVKGYTEDIEDKERINTIDLIGKSIDGYIYLETKQTHDDLQMMERKDDIIRLFIKKKAAINKSRE